MINRFERFSVEMMEIFHYWHKITSDEMEKIGLKGTHSTYLSVLSHYEEGITATHLGDLCGKDKADVSRTVALMEKKGLVTKEGSGTNHYRARIILTDEGKRVAAFVRERACLAVEMAGKGLSDSERAVFYNSLERIAENLARLSQEGLPE